MTLIDIKEILAALLVVVVVIGIIEKIRGDHND